VEEEEVTEMKEKKVLLRKRRELISKEEQSTTKEIQDNNGTSLIGKTELEEAEELLKEAMERLTGATLRTLSNLVRM
jgi:C4-type Zn-finger protein